MTEWEFIAVYHHPGKFGDHRHCALRDSVILICQMTSQKHAFKVSCHVMVSHYPVKFGGHRHCGRRDMFLICHMISQDHMTQQPRDYSQEPFSVSHHPVRFGGHRYCGSGDVTFSVFSKILHACLNPLLLFIWKAPGMSCSHSQNFDTCLEQKQKKNTETNFFSSSKFAIEKKKKKGQLQSFLRRTQTQ